MRTKILLGLALLIVSAVAVVVWQAPELARDYVHDNYHGVTVEGDITIDYFGRTLAFEKVHVTRPGIDGRFDIVRVDESKAVTIWGGSLDVDLDHLVRREGGGSGTSIAARGLTTTVVKGKSKATLQGTTIETNPTEVCFTSADVFVKGHNVEVTGGCAKKEMASPDINDPPELLWTANAQRVSVSVRLPFDVPRMKREQKVVIEGVKLVPNDVPLVDFDKLKAGPFEIIQGRFMLGSAKFAHFFEAESIKANHPWIAPFPVTFPSVTVHVPHNLIANEPAYQLTANGKSPIAREISIKLGPASVYIDPINWSIRGSDTCNDWLEAMPQPLPKALEQARGNFTGSLSFDVRAKPMPHLEIDYACKFKCSQEPIASIRKRQFNYEAYNSKGELFTRKSGRQSNGWVALASLPPHVPDAFRLSEDPGFNHHKGIHVMALQNSLKANLESGSFVKGGSTISMQLAKNLWLKRHKTVGRKAMEALLTIALESCLSKPQIMEYYMNVVEYAPDVYGLGAGTKHHFRKSAFHLQPDEAFFLALLLPNPKRPKTMDWVHRHMRRLANNGHITEHLIPEDEAGSDVDITGWNPVD